MQRIFFFSFFFGFFIFSPMGLAAEISCTAQVTNRKFMLKLDTTTHHLSIKTDNAYEYSGSTTYYYSPRYNADYYYLSTGFTSGLEVQTERDGLKRIALCLKQNECYLCKVN